MRLHNWKIFDKTGSPLNWFPDSYIKLGFDSDTGKGAAGYLITDPSGSITESEITNSGYLYDTDPYIRYDYVFGDGSSVDISNDVSIVYKDVSIFNPNLTNTRGIQTIDNIDISSNFVYPSTVYTSALFLKPVSRGLVETEHLFILEDSSIGLMRPYDNVNSTIIFEMIGEEDEIKLFTIDEENQTVNWTDRLYYDLDEYLPNTPLSINIGFRSDDDGVFERTLRIYHEVDGVLYTLSDIIINAQANPEDERHRTMLSNFGLPDPKDFPTLFKEADINEDLPDFDIINPKSKQMILEHSNIMPYVGTYKALINAIKWLGYDDIYIREWFKNVKEDRKLSLVVPYEAKDRTQTILKFSPDERKTLKKLNQLSLNYCITRETGEIDDWGTPETENCYSYNIQEVFVKLLALKTWLERHIIGVNTRIIDVTGEGVYFETYKNLAYTTDNVGYEYRSSQSMTPLSITDNSELVLGDSSIHLTLGEYDRTKISDLPYTFSSFIDYVWDPNDPSITLEPSDPSYLSNPDRYLAVGPPIGHPFVGIRDIRWQASVEKSVSGMIGTEYVSNPLWVYENQIRFGNMHDKLSIFHNSPSRLGVNIESGYIRDASIDIWEDSIIYRIYPDDSNGGYYIEDVCTGVITDFDSYVHFRPDSSLVSISTLKYEIDDNYKVPLLKIKNFSATDSYNNKFSLDTDKYYNLDIIDGNISMYDYSSNDNVNTYINFHYDNSINEQTITMNAEYTSDRMPLYLIDPSVYYWSDPSNLSGNGNPNNLAIDNSTYTMNVHHIGEYVLEANAWDGYNTMFYGKGNKNHKVWIEFPTIYSLYDVSYGTTDSSISIDDLKHLVSQNSEPIYDRVTPLQGLTVETDSSGNTFINVPSITYFQDLPESGSIGKYTNLTERIDNVMSPTELTIDTDFQQFYTGDKIQMIRYNNDKLDYDSSLYVTITSVGIPDPVNGFQDIEINPGLPLDFYPDTSSDVYLLNDTIRPILSADNIDNKCNITITGDFVFDKTQTISVVVEDVSTSYTWAASYKIIDVSGNINTLDNNINDMFINNPGRYNMYAKYAFSDYSNFEFPIDYSVENDNNFHVYLDDKSCIQYYLDNTFVMMNMLFDQDIVNQQWYDGSANLINSEYYYNSRSIDVDASTLVILNALYDSSNYMLNQQNIWTVTNSIDKTILFRVFNQSVPYIFNEIGQYDVTVESYDSYGNLAKKTFEGFINVV